jgi:hypothetical protein
VCQWLARVERPSGTGEIADLGVPRCDVVYGFPARSEPALNGLGRHMGHGAKTTESQGGAKVGASSVQRTCTAKYQGPSVAQLRHSWLV